MPGTPIPTELKEQALLRLLPPYSWSLRQIANEVGTSPSTILKWRKQLEDEGLLMPKEEREIQQKQISKMRDDIQGFQNEIASFQNLLETGKK